MALVDAHNSAIPGAILPKIGADLSEIGRTSVQNFTPIGKAQAEKSVTVHNEESEWKSRSKLSIPPMLRTAG